MPSLRPLLKKLGFAAATALIAPALLVYGVKRCLLGPDDALKGSSQALALVPGYLGHYLRRAFYCWTLEACAPSVTIECGTYLSRTRARLGNNVYVGPSCHLGWVNLEDDVLIGPGVHVPSGPHTHGIGRTDVPIREQPGKLVCVRVGQGSWIGANAVVLADVGKHAVVMAGAVVTEPVPDYAVVGGVPARVVRSRLDQSLPSPPTS